MNQTKISIIIPVYNEAQNIAQLIEKVKTLYADLKLSSLMMVQRIIQRRLLKRLAPLFTATPTTSVTEQR